MKTELQTERLLLKRLTPDYAQVVFDTYGQDPEVCKYMSWTPHPDVEATRQFLEQQFSKRDIGTTYTYAMIRKDDGFFLGTIELRPKKGLANFGYVLGKQFRGQGYMTEALHALFDLGFSMLGIERIYGICDVDNIASAKVMEKVGMHYIGIREKYILHPNISSEKRDVHRYEIIREKWTK